MKLIAIIAAFYLFASCVNARKGRVLHALQKVLGLGGHHHDKPHHPPPPHPSQPHPSQPHHPPPPHPSPPHLPPVSHPSVHVPPHPPHTKPPTPVEHPHEHHAKPSLPLPATTTTHITHPSITTPPTPHHKHPNLPPKRDDDVMRDVREKAAGIVGDLRHIGKPEITKEFIGDMAKIERELREKNLPYQPSREHMQKGKEHHGEGSVIEAADIMKTIAERRERQRKEGGQPIIHHEPEHGGVHPHEHPHHHEGGHPTIADLTKAAAEARREHEITRPHPPEQPHHETHVEKHEHPIAERVAERVIEEFEQRVQEKEERGERHPHREHHHGHPEGTPQHVAPIVERIQERVDEAIERAAENIRKEEARHHPHHPEAGQYVPPSVVHPHHHHHAQHPEASQHVPPPVTNPHHHQGEGERASGHPHRTKEQLRDAFLKATAHRVYKGDKLNDVEAMEFTAALNEQVLAEKMHHHNIAIVQ